MKQFFLGMLDVLREPLAFVKGAVVFVLGALNYQVEYLLIVMLIDLIFGIQVAVKHRTFQVRILVSKFARKLVMYMLWVTMFHAFDMVSGLPGTARWSVILVLVGLEIFSAIKNTSKLGYNHLADALEDLYLSLLRRGGGIANETRRTEVVETEKIQVIETEHGKEIVTTEQVTHHSVDTIQSHHGDTDIY